MDNRDVSKKLVSKSFRGLLRVSPNDDGTDGGVTEQVEKIVSDSVGNATPLKISQQNVSISSLQATDKLKFNNVTNVPTSIPNKDEILLGDGTNYILQNLKTYIDDYINQNNILENMVPVGSIFHTTLPTIDSPENALKLLPERFQRHYDIPLGQSYHSITKEPYNSTNFPDLYRIVSASPNNTFSDVSLVSVFENQNDSDSKTYLAAAYFYDSPFKPDKLSGFSYTGLDGNTVNFGAPNTQIDYTAFGERILVKKIPIKNTDTTHLSLKWTQKEVNIDVNITDINQYFDSEKQRFYFYKGYDVYLTAGTRIDYNILQAKFINNDGTYTSPQIVALHIDCVAENGDVEKLSLNDGTNYTISKNGLYRIYTSLSRSSSFDYDTPLNFNAFEVTSPFKLHIQQSSISDCVLKFTIDNRKFAYLPISKYNAGKIDLSFDKLNSGFLNDKVSFDISPEFSFIGSNSYRTSSGFFNYFIFTFDNNDKHLYRKYVNCDIFVKYLSVDRKPFGEFKNTNNALYLKQGTQVTIEYIGKSEANQSGFHYDTYLYYPYSIAINDTLGIFHYTLLTTYSHPDYKIQSTVIKDDGWYNYNLSDGKTVPLEIANNFLISFTQPSITLDYSGDAYLMASDIKEYVENSNNMSGASSSSFNLPNLAGRFIRATSTNIINIDSDQGEYNIEPNAPLSTQDPQTNPMAGGSSGADSHQHYLFVNQQFRQNNFKDDDVQTHRSHAVCSRRFTSENPGYYMSWSESPAYTYENPSEADLDNGWLYMSSPPISTGNARAVSNAPLETYPYNIALVPLIKVR